MNPNFPNKGAAALSASCAECGSPLLLCESPRWKNVREISPRGAYALFQSDLYFNCNEPLEEEIQGGGYKK